MNFNEIYEQYKNLVYNTAFQYVQNIEDAQEITQDTFVSIHKTLDSFKYESKISTWIYRITINKSLDFIKAKRRKKRFGYIISIFQDNSNQIKFDAPSLDHPGIALEQKESLEQVFKILSSLPANQKTVIILSCIEDLNNNEIAEIMNINVKAVESLKYRAKNNLKQKFDATE